MKKIKQESNQQIRVKTATGEDVFYFKVIWQSEKHLIDYHILRSQADSNRCIRFCRPLPSHSAMGPKCNKSNFFTLPGDSLDKKSNTSLRAGYPHISVPGHPDTKQFRAAYRRAAAKIVFFSCHLLCKKVNSSQFG